MRFVSPNQIMSEAKRLMLDGREPANRQDWQLVVNFLAFNVDPQLAPQVMKVMRLLYDIPLTEREVLDITQYQQAKHYARN